jgi:hypothetical protein
MNRYMRLFTIVLFFLLSVGSSAQSPFVGMASYSITDEQGKSAGTLIYYSDGTNHRTEEIVGDFTRTNIELTEQRAAYLLITLLGHKLAILNAKPTIQLQNSSPSASSPVDERLGLQCLLTTTNDLPVVFTPQYVTTCANLPQAPGLPVEFQRKGENGTFTYRLQAVNLNVPADIQFVIPEDYLLITADELVNVFNGISAE